MCTLLLVSKNHQSPAILTHKYKNQPRHAKKQNTQTTVTKNTKHVTKAIGMYLLLSILVYTSHHFYLYTQPPPII